MTRWLLLASGLLLTTANAAAEETAADLAVKAQAILKTHCQRCHMPGSAKGGFDYVLERDQLAARKKIVPGSATESELFQRVRDGDMPPRNAKERPSKDDIALLARWLDTGAPAGRPAVARSFITEAAVAERIRADLETIPARQRRFVRYFTLAASSNAGHSDDVLEQERLALAKLLNCLSWHPRITRPVAIDAAQTLLRIDLRDYKWNARLWDRVVFAYPYRLTLATAAAKENAALTGSDHPYVRADWFVATASRAPLYYDLLQMPSTDRGLERLLQVDVAGDINDENVARAGFNGSGVSRNNRLLQRHDAGYGAYWRTYDFSANVDKQNLFDHPLGPPPAPSAFVPAGGEAIFHLPNGLHGYLLVDGTGRRVDKAPVDIVSDPQRPDRAVEAGLSCMSCHAPGFLPKADQVRAHVLKNAQAFPKETVETVRALYPSPARFKGLIDQDNERYLKALARTGVRPEDAEPITAVTLRYEGIVDLASAAADAGLAATEFMTRLAKASTLNRSLGALLVDGGTVQRQAWQTAFAEVVRELQLDKATDVGTATPVAAKPFSGHTGAILALAFAPDGKQAVSGSEDRTLRMWDVESGKELRRFEGHSSAVAAVAFAKNGAWLLSGGDDRLLRLWDATTGKELARLEGHTDRITSVAGDFTGKYAFTGSRDGSVRLWDLEERKELHCFTGHKGWVNSVAFNVYGTPDWGVSGGHDGTVRLWDLRKLTEARRFEGLTREVYAVAIFDSSRKVAAAGNDRTVVVWNARSGAVEQRLQGHGNAVIALQPTHKGLWSASSQYQQADKFLRHWSLETGKEASQLGADHERVSCAAFARDGRLALTSGPDQTLRLWKLKE